MKKKLLALMILASMAISLTACGGADDTADVAGDETTTTEKDTTEKDTTDEADASGSEDFSLLDVSADMIKTALYAKNTEGGSEIVFSIFTTPDGAEMCSLFDIVSEGTDVASGDVYCGEYTAKTEEPDENGISWTELTFDDVYTGQNVTIGFAEAEDVCYIASPSGNTYEAKYLTADEAITYMGVGASLLK